MFKASEEWNAGSNDAIFRNVNICTPYTLFLLLLLPRGNRTHVCAHIAANAPTNGGDSLTLECSRYLFFPMRSSLFG